MQLLPERKRRRMRFAGIGVLWLTFCVCTQATAQHPAPSGGNWPGEARRLAPGFYLTDEARRIGENVLLYQLQSGA